MSKQGYKITRSNYTVRKKHKKLSDGSTIYERDFMATANLGSFGGSTIPNSESNFKFVYNSRQDKTRSHKYGNWLKPDNSKGRDYWTVNDVNEEVSQNGSSKEIVIKPNNNSLLDFAYFGSCTELIRVSVMDILKRYPGELFVTDSIVGIGESEWGPFGGKDLYLVENPFLIDIISKSVLNTIDDFNELRYFCKSVDKYRILDANAAFVSCVNEWSVIYYDKPIRCLENGGIGSYAKLATVNGKDFFIAQYNFNGKIVLVTEKDFIGFHVRPTESYYDDFYKECDDFEKLMLNENNFPKFTMILDTPEETENGVISYRKKYTWPMNGGWNLEVEGHYYEEYINSLLEIASFYDEYSTNNLWRMLTHESIKNLDKTYTKDNSDETSEDIMEGVGRMEGFLLSCARLFDDFIRYTNAITSVNEITYNQNNNIPDYFISDDLENKGWEVYDPVLALDTITVGELYSGSTKCYTKNDANVLFMKNLSITSKDILKKKGTRRCIEEVLGLFGLISYDMAKGNKKYKYIDDEGQEKYAYRFTDIPKDKNNNRYSYTEEGLTAEELREFYDYKISEYVYVASPKDGEYNKGLMQAYPETKVFTETDDDGKIISSMEIATEVDVEKYNRLKLNNKGGINEPLRGLPCTYVYFEDEEGEVYKYIVPWVADVKEIDGVPYFQLFGGWGKRSKLPNTDVIPTNFTVFSETERYLQIVKNIGELSEKSATELIDGEIFYVYDINDINDYYNFSTTRTEDASHYFVIKNRFSSFYYSSDETPSEVTDGWYNIKTSDISNINGYGINVVYLDSIIDETRGNNPHTGRGKYDQGKSFRGYFEQLFKYSIENSNFTDDAYDCSMGTIKNDIINTGFNIEEQEDNNKVWYFTEMLSDDEGKSVYTLVRKTKNTYEVSTDKTFTKVGESGTTFFDSKLVPYDPENIIGDEIRKTVLNGRGASYSVINDKRIKIDFCGTYCAMNGFEDYLNKCIIPYLYQVIPSTSLLEIELSGLECTTVERGNIRIAEIMAISNDDDVQYEYVSANAEESETWIELTNKEEIPYPNAQSYRYIKIGNEHYKLIKKI